MPGFRLVAAMLLYVHSCGSTCKPHAGNRLADHKAENRRLTMGEMLIEGSEGTLRLDGDGALWLRSHGQSPQQFKFSLLQPRLRTLDPSARHSKLVSLHVHAILLPFAY